MTDQLAVPPSPFPLHHHSDGLRPQGLGDNHMIATPNKVLRHDYRNPSASLFMA